MGLSHAGLPFDVFETGPMLCRIRNESMCALRDFVGVLVSDLRNGDKSVRKPPRAHEGNAMALNAGQKCFNGRRVDQNIESCTRATARSPVSLALDRARRIGGTRRLFAQG